VPKLSYTVGVNDPIRLNKFLALRLGLSRRAADQMIGQGRVLVSDHTAELGARFTPHVDTLAIDGKAIDAHQDTELIYLALNKPIGYVSSRRQQGTSPTIYELLPTEYHHLKPVGRLDRDSSGLLLLTNDGDFAHQMTHPSFSKAKTYEITLDKPLQPLHRQMIQDHGVLLDDGPSKLQLERQVESDELNWIVLMHEGRNRQIRRTFAALGYTVTRLHRTIFGPYQLADLPAGKYQSVAKVS